MNFREIMEQPTSTSAQATIKGLSTNDMEQDPRFQAIYKDELAKGKQFKDPRAEQRAQQIAAMRYKSELASGKTPPPAGVTVTPVSNNQPTASPVPPATNQGTKDMATPQQVAATPKTTTPATGAAAATDPGLTPDQVAAQQAAMKAPATGAAAATDPGLTPDQVAAQQAAMKAPAAPAAAPAAPAAAKPGSWQEIYNLNKAVIGNNPDLIKPGQQLKMPDGSTYTVKKGDNLTKIARGGGKAAAPAAPAAPAADAQTAAMDKELDAASAESDALRQQAAMDKELDSASAEMDRLKKNAGVAANQPPTPAGVPNPWEGTDPVKAAAWAKLSPEDQKWLGNADPTDPAILARAPSQPSAASQVASGVRDIGRNIRGAFGFGPKAQQPTQQAAAPVPGAAPTFESRDFQRMLELAGVDKSFFKKKKLDESAVTEALPLAAAAPAAWAAARTAIPKAAKWAASKFQKPSTPPAAPPAPAIPAKITRPSNISKNKWNRMSPAQKQAASQKSVPTAPTTPAPAKPDGISQSTWDTLSPAKQSEIAARAAKQELRRVAPTAGQKAADLAMANPKTTLAGVGLGGYGAYELGKSLGNDETAADRPSAAPGKDIAPPTEIGTPSANPKYQYDPENDTIKPYHTRRELWQLKPGEDWADPLSQRQKQSNESLISEAEYQGRDVQLGKPMSSGDGKSKYKVYVRDPRTGNIRKVTFGDPNMEIKRDDPERRKNFRARHGCGTPRASDRTKAAYWSCRMWSSKPISKILKGK